MSEKVGNERFLSWDEARLFVGEQGVLNETGELYYRYAGFVSVEMAEKHYERVYVNGFLRIYPEDVGELRSGFPISCNNARLNGYSTINGVFRSELLEKFIVFDDELVISVDRGGVAGEGEVLYPAGVFFREADLNATCAKFGLTPRMPGEEENRHSLPSRRELDLLRTIGAMSCLLARQRGVDFAQEWHHLSDSFIDEFFETLSALGVETEGKAKFLYERLISEGVMLLLVPAMEPQS